MSGVRAPVEDLVNAELEPVFTFVRRLVRTVLARREAALSEQPVGRIRNMTRRKTLIFIWLRAALLRQEGKFTNRGRQSEGRINLTREIGVQG